VNTVASVGEWKLIYSPSPMARKNEDTFLLENGDDKKRSLTTINVPFLKRTGNEKFIYLRDILAVSLSPPQKSPPYLVLYTTMKVR